MIQIMTFPVFLYNFQTMPVFSFLCNIVGIPLGTLLIQLIFLVLLLNVFGIELFNKIFLLIIKFIFNAFETIIYFLDKIPLLQINVEFRIHWILILFYYIIITAGIQLLRHYELKYGYKKPLSIKWIIFVSCCYFWYNIENTE